MRPTHAERKRTSQTYGKEEGERESINSSYVATTTEGGQQFSGFPGKLGSVVVRSTFSSPPCVYLWLRGRSRRSSKEEEKEKKRTFLKKKKRKRKRKKTLFCQKIKKKVWKRSLLICTDTEKTLGQTDSGRPRANKRETLS